MDREQNTFANELIANLLSYYSKNPDFLIFLTAKDKIPANTLSITNMLFPLIEKYLLTNKIFKTPLFNSGLLQYFKDEINSDPESFLRQFLPVGFKFDKEEHIQWMIESTFSQIEIASRNFLSILFAYPSKSQLNTGFKDFLGKIKQVLGSLSKTPNYPSFDKFILSFKEKILQSNTTPEIKNSQIQFLDNIQSFFKNLIKEEKLPDFDELLIPFKEIFKFPYKFKDEEKYFNPIKYYLSLSKQNKESANNLINDGLHFLLKNNFGIGRMESLTSSYLIAYDSIITFFIRPLYLSKNQDLSEEEVMKINVPKLIEGLEDQSLLPEKILNPLRNFLKPYLRNAFAHRNFLIREEKEISYFQSPYQSPYNSYPLNFDQKIPKDELLGYSLFLSSFMIELNVSKYIALHSFLLEKTQSSQLDYLFWEPYDIINNIQDNALLEYLTPTSLIKYLARDPTNKKIVLQSIENAFLELIMIMNKENGGKSPFKYEGSFEDSCKEFWKSVESSELKKDHKVIFAYFLYLVGQLNNNWDKWNVFVDEYILYFGNDSQSILNIENEFKTACIRFPNPNDENLPIVNLKINMSYSLRIKATILQDLFNSLKNS